MSSRGLVLPGQIPGHPRILVVLSHYELQSLFDCASEVVPSIISTRITLSSESSMASIDTPLSLLDRLVDHDDDKAWRRFAEIYEPLIRRWVIRSGSHNRPIWTISCKKSCPPCSRDFPHFSITHAPVHSGHGSGPSRSIGFAATGERRARLLRRPRTCTDLEDPR